MFLKTIGLLRGILKREGPAILAAFPNHRRPCHTCAFNPARDNDRGFDSTVLGLAGALIKDRPFYCHEPMPKDETGDWLFDPQTATLCAGYAMILGAAQDAKRAVVRGMVEGDLSDERADWLLEGMIETFPCDAKRKVVPWATEADLKPFR